MRVCRHMYFILWLLVGHARAVLDALCGDTILQEERTIPENHPSLSGVPAGSNISGQFGPQRTIEENDTFARIHRPSAITSPLQREKPDEAINLVDMAQHAQGACSEASLHHQEAGNYTQAPIANKTLLSKGTTSEEFRAQMAKDVLSMKNTLPPSHAALNETLAVMNSRVILPSAVTVRWFSNKDGTDEALHTLMALLHYKCALAYHATPAQIRERKETDLFQAFSPFKSHAFNPLSGAELRTLALHRRYIGMLANYSIYSSTGIATTHAIMNSQSRAQLPTFDYSAIDPQMQPRLCVCLSVQLLVSGFFSYIPASFIPVIQSVPPMDAAQLVSYALTPDCVKLFPEFITAFYIIWSGLCTDPKSPALLLRHSDIIKCLPASMRLLDGGEFAAQLLHLSQLVADCIPALSALGGGELADGSPELLAATEKASVYWHALSALATLTAPQPDSTNAAAGRPGTIDAVSTVTEHSALADRLVQLLAPPIAATASLSSWEAVLTALIYAMPSIDVYAFMVARTPPAFAGPLLRYEIIHPTVYVIIVSLWLAFETPHTDSILANMDAMYSRPAYRYKALLLMRLPVSLFARAPAGLLRKICRTLFEQERARGKKQRRNGSLKWPACIYPGSARRVLKRRRGSSQDSIGVGAAREDAQSLSNENTADEAQMKAPPVEESRNRESRAIKWQLPRFLSAQDACEQPPSTAATVKNHNIPLGRLSLNLYIHCRTPDDITDEELAHLMGSRVALSYLTSLCCAIADGESQIQSISRIGYLEPSLAKIHRELLEMFRAPPHTATSACTNAPGAPVSTYGRCEDTAPCTKVYETHVHNASEAEQTGPERQDSIGSLSLGCTNGAHDISWDVYANSKHCMATLPAFFARQLLPHLIDVICTNRYLSNSVKLLSMVGHILKVDGLASGMQLLEETLSDTATALQALHQMIPGLALTAPQRASAALLDTPWFILKKDPELRVSLRDMELFIRPCVVSTFLDARAYMEISDALRRLVFHILSVGSFTRRRFAPSEEMRCFLTQIVCLLPRECPFIYQASGSAAQARIKCTWSPVFRSAPSRVSPTIIPEAHVVSAVKNTCYYCLYALYNNAQAEQWLALFAWLFTQSAVQSLIASPACLLSESDEQAVKVHAAAITSCLRSISSFIVAVATREDYQNTSAGGKNNPAHTLAQTDSSGDIPRHSLITMMIKLLSLFNVSETVLNEHLANLYRVNRPSATEYL